MGPLDVVHVIPREGEPYVVDLNGKPIEVGDKLEPDYARALQADLNKRYPLTVGQINEAIKHVDSNEVSDGYHTFKELYDHRIELWIALCRSENAWMVHGESCCPEEVWRSKKHSDGLPAFGGGWFVLGIWHEKGKQITYHLPMSYWDQCDFAQELNKAPEWDGHSSADVLERLKTLFGKWTD